MEQFVALLAEALEKEEELNPGDEFREYEEWDSLAVLSIIAMIKQNYDIIIPRKNFETLITIEDLFSFVSAQK